MKNYCYLISVFIAVFVIAGCAKNENDVLYSGDSPVFEALFADAQTKTYVDGNMKLLWHAEDQISIFYTTLNKQYQFNGKTGENSGTFTDLMAGQFGTGNSTSANYAVYPYLESTRLSNEEILTVSLPIEQEYGEKSFGKGANTMVAVTSGPEDLFLPFKNVGGFIKLQLYGKNVTVSSIVFKGNGNEKIAGDATIKAQYNVDPKVVNIENGTEVITLKCGENGVPLGDTEKDSKEFWFVVPPIKFESGFTISIVDIYGNIMQKSTNKSFEVERNTIKTMDAIEVEIDAENYANQITYTTTDNAILAIDESKFDAKILSHKYENGTGKIVFDEQLKSIADDAFRLKTTLKSIKLPEGIDIIGENAFESCIQLISINLPTSVKKIDQYAFKGCGKIKSMKMFDGLTTIEYGAFSDCRSLTGIEMPESVVSIGTYAFKNCSSIESIIIPKGITVINSGTFSGCASLKSIVIPDGVTHIESGAFEGCSALISIVLPESLCKIGKFTFLDCVALSNIDIPESVYDIGVGAFGGCSSLKSIVLPDKITSIFEFTFQDCSLIESIEIPEGVISIGDGAFRECTTLKSIKIPEGVTLIGPRVFYGCTSLTSIDLPEGLVSIGDDAFYSCRNLNVVTSKAVSSPALGRNAFSEISQSAILKVPKGCKSSYESSAWKDYFVSIEELE